MACLRIVQHLPLAVVSERVRKSICSKSSLYDCIMYLFIKIIFYNYFIKLFM